MSDGAYGFVVGGCWYRMQCRDRVAASLAALGYLAGVAQAPFLGVKVQHTSALPQGRCEWLRSVIDDGRVRWAVSVDSDTAFNAGHLMDQFKRVTDPSVAIAIAPVRIGGTEGVCNINLSSDDERLSDGLRAKADGEVRIFREELTRVLSGTGDIASGGFGLAIFHLPWFRENWARPFPEVSSLVGYDGEDIEFCRAVRRRGGRVIALPIETDHHEFKP